MPKREEFTMVQSRRASILLFLLATAAPAFCGSQWSDPQSSPAFHSLPLEWAGEWDSVGSLENGPTAAKAYKDTPAHEAADPLIKSLLTPWGKAKMEATSYDDAPGSMCDPEGWFPFINYGYGFALLASPQKITIIPVEADTEGIRRVYLRQSHPEKMEPTWNGNSIAHWEGETLVVDTVGFNELSWLGDDREPHTTALHLVERYRLLDGGKVLEIESQVFDAKALTAPYTLTRHFMRWNAAHLGAGPDRNMAELVCNEDPSPFLKKEQVKPAAKSAP